MTTLPLVKIADNIWRVDQNVDLVYSEHDDEQTGKGWYLQKYPGGLVSHTFITDLAAVRAYVGGKVKFPEKQKSKKLSQ